MEQQAQHNFLIHVYIFLPGIPRSKLAVSLSAHFANFQEALCLKNTRACRRARKRNYVFRGPQDAALVGSFHDLPAVVKQLWVIKNA